VRTRRRNTKPKTEAKPTKIRGGNTARAVPGRFSNLFDITNTATMIKRE
jgi:hypothetical protein